MISLTVTRETYSCCTSMIRSGLLLPSGVLVLQSSISLYQDVQDSVSTFLVHLALGIDTEQLHLEMGIAN